MGSDAAPSVDDAMGSYAAYADDDCATSPEAPGRRAVSAGLAHVFDGKFPVQLGPGHSKHTHG